MTERFVSAATGGDVSALMQVLAPDVTLWSDGGGKARAARSLVHGRDKVARLIAGGSSRRPVADPGVRYRQVNGEPAAVLTSVGIPYLLVVLDLVPGGDQARGVYAITNPDKLSRLGEQR